MPSTPGLKIPNTEEMAALLNAGQRPQERLEWVRSITGEASPCIVPASEDASFRSYWRIEGLQPPQVLMDAPPQHEDITAWLATGEKLRAAGLHAPRVYSSDSVRGFVLMEDLGDALYLPALNAGSADRLYGDAVGALLRMQRDVPVHDLPAYDRHRLRQELDLLRIWFLSRHLDAKLQRGGEDALEAGFHALIENALEQPQVFVHRDFHSRNLLIVDRNSPGILDFQDAVCGPVTYDLVSLLRDCYIEWQPSRVEEWVDNYRVRAVAFGLINSDPVTFRRWFDWMGVQRHLKVLGIFCRLWYRDGKRQYLGDLPRVWGYVREVSSAYTELQPLHECLERCIGDRDLTEPAD